MEGLQGDVVVVPGVGVGNVEGTETMDVMGEEVELTRISCGDQVETMYVPPDNFAAEGIREPIPADKVDVILETIDETEAPKKRGNWNRRRRRYEKILMGNDPLELASLLGELDSVRSRKTLSFHERALYDRVKVLIRDELTVAMGGDELQAHERLEDVLGEAA